MAFNLPNILGGLGGMGGAKGGFPQTLQASDFSATTNVAVITTDYTKIGSYTIPAQQEISVGYGSAAMSSNQGYIYVVLKSSTDVAMKGMFRVAYSDANETRRTKVFEMHTDELGGSATDRSLKVALPEQVGKISEFGRRPREDDRIQIWFKPETAGTWGTTNSTIRIPVTVYQ